MSLDTVSPGNWSFTPISDRSGPRLPLGPGEKLKSSRVPGPVPQVETGFTWADRFGAWKARWGVNRMNYRVSPGLYRVGTPGAESPVLVTGNYKLSFDILRTSIPGMDAWILALDTKGINVWCAAGKGTFGTEELVRRIGAVSLPDYVAHRKLILPQLGAVGVDAAEVARRSGFSVVWGPVRASDVPAFIASGNVATTRMRRVFFTLRDRLVLTPVEIVQSAKAALPVLGVILVVLMLGAVRFDRTDFLGLVGAWLAGSVAAPALLPWIPGRAFSWKGAVAGAVWAAFWIAANSPDAFRIASWALLFPALASFLTMNFTGSSTYTSFSGVIAEMRVAVPLIAVAAFLGSACLVAGAFIGG